MEKITPVWLPHEKECLLAIVEQLIYDDLLDTREKLGEPTVTQVDANFWINFDLKFDRLIESSELLYVISDFLVSFWLPQDRAWSLVPCSSHNATANKMIKKFAGDWQLEWRDDGNALLVDVMTPRTAEFIRKHQAQLTRIITFLGPGLHYAHSTWGLEPEQYKALVSWDTLECLAPRVRWNMIYGSMTV